jgi:undecaprenyl diphosphate synthase
LLQADHQTETVTNGQPLPAHIAIIMDGNGRWATARSLSRSEGHRAGAEAVRRVVTACRRLGVRHLTLYSFSKENWSRPKEEVSHLFGLLVDFLTKELPTLQENDISLHVFGDLDRLPLASRKALTYAMGKCRDNKGMCLNLALNYSGRDEILAACRKYMESGGKPEDLTSEIFSGQLYSAGQPDPDLVIRTSGEQRISNFLLFQSAYSEFYFTPTLWPDFGEAELNEALRSYAGRKRRFGGL